MKITVYAQNQWEEDDSMEGQDASALPHRWSFASRTRSLAGALDMGTQVQWYPIIRRVRVRDNYFSISKIKFPSPVVWDWSVTNSLSFNNNKNPVKINYFLWFSWTYWFCPLLKVIEITWQTLLDDFFIGLVTRVLHSYLR